MIVRVDAGEETIVARFYPPKEFRAADITFLKGRVVLSGNPEIVPGVGIVTAGPSVQHILDEGGSNKLFLVKLKPNTRQQSDPGKEPFPKWFASEVMVIEDAEKSSTALLLLDGAMGQLRALRETLG
jgi:hypothetical protein